jgi:hypothetical protein
VFHPIKGNSFFAGGLFKAGMIRVSFSRYDTLLILRAFTPEAIGEKHFGEFACMTGSMRNSDMQVKIGNKPLFFKRCGWCTSQNESIQL